MKKKVYSKPVLTSEEFVPQCYCNVCGDSGTTYFFECNAGERGLELWNFPYKVYVDYKGNGEYTYRSKYHACGETHRAASNSGIYKGYMIDTRTSERTDVMVWTEDGKDTHCTTNLDISKWEIAKS